MKRTTELGLMDELRQLHGRDEKFLDKEVARSPIDRYRSAERFALERERLFLRVPVIAAASLDLDGPGAFRRVDLFGVPLLLTRDRDGVAHALANVCRHRGARLVQDDSGCRHRFSCPYHAWTYSNSGELLSVTHEEAGFPALDKKSHGLRRFGCVEKYGMIWVSLADEAPPDLDAWLGELAADVEALDLARHRLFSTDDLDLAMNWKIFLEGGLETYHFRIAHRQTVGPLFVDTLSSYRSFGAHLRSVLPRSTMPELDEAEREQWCLRDHANLLYTLTPTTQFLVQQDHVAWAHLQPLAADRTRVRITMLVPSDSTAPESYWHSNHEFTMKTLHEDFALGESIQAGLGTGGDTLLFGRYEGALETFNRAVETLISD